MTSSLNSKVKLDYAISEPSLGNSPLKTPDPKKLSRLLFQIHKKLLSNRDNYVTMQVPPSDGIKSVPVPFT